MAVKQYIFGFVDYHGVPYDYHMSDDLKSRRTWEAIEIKFSLPDSQYIFVWRRDEKEFDESDVKYLAKYVSKDMEDFMDEGKMSNTNQTKILHKLQPSKKCIVFSYGNMHIPDSLLHAIYASTEVYTEEAAWNYLEDETYDDVFERSKDALDGKNDSENIENVLDPDIGILGHWKQA